MQPGATSTTARGALSLLNAGPAHGTDPPAGGLHLNLPMRLSEDLEFFTQRH